MKFASILALAAFAVAVNSVADAAEAQGKSCMAKLPVPTPEQAARGKSWFINNEKIELLGKAYVKYGLPRVLGPGDVDHGADYRGVAVGFEAGSTQRDVIYVFTEAPCEFQPYQVDPGY